MSAGTLSASDLSAIRARADALETSEPALICAALDRERLLAHVEALEAENAELRSTIRAEMDAAATRGHVLVGVKIE